MYSSLVCMQLRLSKCGSVEISNRNTEESPWMLWKAIPVGRLTATAALPHIIHSYESSPKEMSLLLHFCAVRWCWSTHVCMRGCMLWSYSLILRFQLIRFCSSSVLLQVSFMEFLGLSKSLSPASQWQSVSDILIRQRSSSSQILNYRPTVFLSSYRYSVYVNTEQVWHFKCNLNLIPSMIFLLWNECNFKITLNWRQKFVDVQECRWKWK